MEKRNRKDVQNIFSYKNSSNISKYILLVIVIFVGILRYRFLDMPLERDEGGFAYIAKLILEGFPPYLYAYDFKPPGLYLTYAAFIGLFGTTTKAVHLGLLFVNLGSVVLIYFLVKRLLNSVAGLMAALVFGLLSLDQGVLGFAAHATHFVVFWMLVGYLLLVEAAEQNKKHFLFFSGIAFGLSFLMKQPGALFIIFAIIIAGISNGSPRFNYKNKFMCGSILIGGAIVPIIITVIWLWITGALNKFIFWNYEYGISFGERLSLTDALQQFIISFPMVAVHFILIWIMAGIGFIMIFFDPYVKRIRSQLILFSLFSFLAVSLGFQYRPHYFVLFIPAISIFSSFCVLSFVNQLQRKGFSLSELFIPILLFLIIVGFELGANRKYLFSNDLITISRSIYFPNPFAESQIIGEFIRSHTEENERIAILGSEPQILFYANRKSVSRYIYTYFFMETHKYSFEMQREMIKEIEQASPKYLIFINQPMSWAVQPRSIKYIFSWAKTYIKDKYKLEGVVDILSQGETVYRLGEEVENYPNALNATVQIFKRRL
jgi:hypothetical protein